MLKQSSIELPGHFYPFAIITFGVSNHNICGRIAAATRQSNSVVNMILAQNRFAAPPATQDSVLIGLSLYLQLNILCCMVALGMSFAGAVAVAFNSVFFQIASTPPSGVFTQFFTVLCIIPAVIGALFISVGRVPLSFILPRFFNVLVTLLPMALIYSVSIGSVIQPISSAFPIPNQYVMGMTFLSQSIRIPFTVTTLTCSNFVWVAFSPLTLVGATAFSAVVFQSVSTSPVWWKERTRCGVLPLTLCTTFGWCDRIAHALTPRLSESWWALLRRDQHLYFSAHNPAVQMTVKDV